MGIIRDLLKETSTARSRAYPSKVNGMGSKMRARLD